MRRLRLGLVSKTGVHWQVDSACPSASTVITGACSDIVSLLSIFDFGHGTAAIRVGPDSGRAGPDCDGLLCHRPTRYTLLEHESDTLASRHWQLSPSIILSYRNFIIRAAIFLPRFRRAAAAAAGEGEDENNFQNVRLGRHR